jgi:two-component system CheB/CheR fusion protein
MLLLECIDEANKGLGLKVFSTDAAPHVLARARAGLFPASVAEEMPAERLERFFEKQGDYYQAKKRLREAIVFAPHNMLADPPFSQMDLVSCRNLLIYLAPEVQSRLIKLLHFALREGGYLFLGTAETIGDQEDLFHTISKKWRIYRRIGPTRHDIVNFPLAETAHRSGPAHTGTPLPGGAETARMALLNQFAPPSVLVDDRMRILYFHGDTDAYLRQPRGEPTQELMMLARDDLAPRLRGAIHRALRDRQPSIVEVRRSTDGPAVLRIMATPLAGHEGEQARVLVSFIEVRSSPSIAGAPSGPVPEHAPATENELEEALRASQLELRETVEQLESSNEELKASNEEMTSMNEELQATNEELETSKEELQSLNEELNTVNMQLQTKLEELEDRTNDLNNLLNSSAIATLFLSEDLRIRWFTPPLAELLDVIPSDIGRPLNQLAPKFQDPDFADDAREVLRTLQPREREVTSNDGRWYVRRILPYRTEDNRIEGVVATFVDITGRKRGEQELAAAKEFAERIVDTVRQPLIVLDSDLRVVSANRSFLDSYSLMSRDVIGRRLLDLGGGGWDMPALRNLLEEILPERETLTDYEVEGEFAAMGHRSMLLNAQRLDGARLILLAIEDVTERRRGERRQQALLDELQHRVKNLFGNIFSLLRLSSRNATDVAVFVEAFSSRLKALERTQRVLMSREDSTVSLRALVEAELHAHGGDAMGSVTVEGLDFGIDSRTAQALGMVVHELATNALKHGALANSGRIHISWARVQDGANLLFRWRETGVPGGAKEIDGGFGSHLIRQVVPYVLGGSAQLEHTQDGLRCILELPIDGEGRSEE